MSKEVKELSIKYRSSVVEKGEIDGEVYSEYDYDFVSASTKFTKRYSNALCLLMGISECPHKLLDWIQENMSDGGYVSNNEITRRAFIAFHKRYSTEKPYSDHSVNKAFQQLSETGLLVSVSKGIYQVNPMFFWGEKSEAERVTKIKYMMEFKAGVETKISVEVNKK